MRPTTTTTNYHHLNLSAEDSSNGTYHGVADALKLLG